MEHESTVKMITVIYTRVSTDKQSCDSQTKELREYAARKGWTNVQEITDQISGSKFTRTGLDELMKLVRLRKVSHVLCFKLDRLGRSLPHLAQLIEEFTAHNVALIVPGQGIDTSDDNPVAQLQRNMLMAFAQFERDLIRERVNAGLSAAKARGVKLGKKPIPELLRANVIQLITEGKGTREIGKLLGMPPSTVNNVKRSMAA